MKIALNAGANGPLKKARIIMSNNSYVYIPVDKLSELIKTTCPPCARTICRDCLADEERIKCVNCWREWLMDGDSNG